MGWVLDLDGVVWLGEEAIPGAAEAVERLRAAGEQVVFATNNSSEPVARYEEKLRGMGYRLWATSSPRRSSLHPWWLPAPWRSCAVGLVWSRRSGGGTWRPCVRGVQTWSWSVTTVTSTTTGWRPRPPRFDAEARLIATNDDPTYPTPEGLLPGAGALVAAVAAASGARPVIAGKPHEAAVAYVRSMMGEDGMVVGDRPDTDGAFARELGYDFGLVLSGVTTPSDLPVQPEPAVVAANLGALVERVLGS